MNWQSEITPIFIIGVQHSGTTILNKLLAMHPDVAWFSQFSQRDGNIPGRLRFPFHRFANRFLRCRFTHDWRKITGASMKEKFREYFVPAPRERSQIWDYILPSESMIYSTEFISRMRTIFSKECSEWGKKVLIVKYLILTPNINILHSVYPEAKFIHIIRDGRAVALSIKEKMHGEGDSQTDALQKGARYWVDILSIVQEQKQNINIYEVRYEDFCLSPREEIYRILKFADLKVQKYPFEKCPEALRISNPKQIERATNEEIEMLNGILKQWLSFYEYETISGQKG